MHRTDRLHLTVIQPVIVPEDGPTQAASIEVQCSNPVEFRWNGDGTAFRVAELRWWDDRSYIRYQCDDGL